MTELVKIRLSHPWHYCDPLAVLDVAPTTAAALIRGGVAQRVDNLIHHTGGGYYTVELANPRRIIRKRGYPAALATLDRNSE